MKAKEINIPIEIQQRIKSPAKFKNRDYSIGHPRYTDDVCFVPLRIDLGDGFNWEIELEFAYSEYYTKSEIENLINNSGAIKL